MENTKPKKPKILITEDDEFFVKMLSRKFEMENFDVSVAKSGQEVMNFLDSNVPDIVVLDLMLPGLSGYEILALIKKGEKTKNVPVIILSNLGQQEEIEKAMALGASEFMVKVNFTLEEIVARVKKILEKTKGAQI